MSVSNPEFSESSLLRPVEISREDHLPKKGASLALMMAAIGVVFGDIGTSPLYALKECFSPEHGIPFSADAVYGVISMVFWAFAIVVSLKYVLFVMRANNNGEGGILALMALALRTAPAGSKRAFLIIMSGVFGACMFYGDAIITPAISVLSAVEGMEVISPDFTRYVLPTTILILILLFFIQKTGTAVVGNLFGPVMLVWFAVIGLMGLNQVVQNPAIFAAVNPLYAVRFMQENALQGFIVLGAVFLVLTGAEALYADMGHFGAKPIRMGWFFVVMPCLILNYFGQGAMFLNNPEAIQNPFFLMVPEAFVFPLVILATVATVIASQAVISGAFSMTSQAILLGFVPRMKVQHTSDKEIGQIYMPLINWTLLVLVVAVVLAFKKSENLAAAYGIAVTTTMIVTTFLAAIVMRVVWRWNTILVSLVIGAFLVVDFAFLLANLLKIMEGGWFPLLLGAACFLLLMTWYQGRQLLRQHATDNGIELKGFIDSLMKHPPHRVEGTAIFLTAHVDYLPVSFLHNLKHNHVLHERVFFLKVSIWDVPYVKDDERITLRDLGNGIYVVRAVYGFNETPDMLKILELIEHNSDLKFDLMNTSFFLSRDTIVSTEIPGMAMWRERLFCWMYQNAGRQSDFFKIPTNRLVELGAKVEI
ncbi:KUP system potassium uptake protein [Polynucleobacter sphagniphilus]|jgi:KUP system potassium uptake protein|uniref:Probable potassium transport system protein Kup n=2 Tax=Polynucleobacter sphagniphilus TaxID=1743169 RepID=A0AA43M6W2_9BURK|nr:KUP system potassium uptake protein [Polynucleobacter sphagniphilus]MDH6154256.1 KUP system potassium uptake protein [Polynucleobacter sphagniphilus]MDH6240525.1 KUP system potassium uptake protein [Polynucleobacter sphagniphilus]MDH6299899.1 KUP system potassium uptake protein [Polynucleobacter sphagniphilus]MDH6301760.1 KUP system potassium uptake protein [Polynucleobacter sphagniphilus]